MPALKDAVDTSHRANYVPKMLNRLPIHLKQLPVKLKEPHEQLESMADEDVKTKLNDANRQGARHSSERSA